MAARKKARTAKQKAATRKLVALNKRRAKPKRKAAKARKSPKRKAAKRRASPKRKSKVSAKPRKTMAKKRNFFIIILKNM